MKYKIYLIITLISVFLVGCNSAKLSLIPPDGIILAFGDSLTKGKGVNISDSYPAILSNLTNKNVVNAGIIGEETSAGMLRLPVVLKEVNPDLLILLEGGNDILRDRDSAVIKNNLSVMITQATKMGIPVVLVGVPDKTLVDNSSDIYKELAAKYDLVVDENIIKTLLLNPEFKSDKHHFNKEGYRRLAEALFRLMRENGAF